MNNLRFSIASGKGGTGKTLVATNLFYTLSEEGVNTELIDCDTERCNKCFCFYLASINEKKNNPDWISIFPNPTQGSLTIKVDKPYSKIKVEIIDGKGSVIYKKERIENPIIFKERIHGVYVVRLSVDKEMIMKKIIIE